MSSQALFRLAALALAASAISLAAGLILHPSPPPFAANTVASSQWAVAHFLWWLGGMAGIPGLLGLYLRQRAELGLWGFIGAGLAIAGAALIACAMYFEAFIAPFVAARAPELFQSYPAGSGWEGFLAGVLASGALFGVGFLILAIGMIRTRLMPRWAVVLAAVGGIPFAVNFLFPYPIAALAAAVLGLGLLGLSHALWNSVETLALGVRATSRS